MCNAVSVEQVMKGLSCRASDRKHSDGLAAEDANDPGDVDAAPARIVAGRFAAHLLGRHDGLGARRDIERRVQRERCNKDHGYAEIRRSASATARIVVMKLSGLREIESIPSSTRKAANSG
jgi:hypothetical protein